MQSLRWRIITTLVVLALGLAYMLPSIPGVEGSVLGKFLPGKSVNLGLDLKGGIHLTLGVDMDTAMQNNLARLGDDLKAAARDENIFALRPNVLSDTRVRSLSSRVIRKRLLKKSLISIHHLQSRRLKRWTAEKSNTSSLYLLSTEMR